MSKKSDNHARYMREVWYPRNKEKQIAASQNYRKKNACLKRWLVNEIKLSMGCTDCGYNTHAVALDFDHTRDKEFDIGDGIGRGLKLDTILNEIEKCVVRCSNCHRIKTYLGVA